MAAVGAASTGAHVKRALPLLALALVVGLYAWINVQRTSAPATTANDAASDDSSNSYTANNVELIETGEDGMPRYHLQAAHIAQQSTNSPVELQLPRISFSGATGARDGGLDWQLSATSGTLSPKHDEVEFSGQVQGQASGGGTPVLRLATSELTVNTVQQVVRSSQNVDLDWAGIHLTASSIRIELRSGVVKIGPGHGFQTP
jgi:LPS export ABC transporter protein LptC